MHWRILAVVLVAATAGCGSVVGFGGNSAPETVTPAPVPTPPPTPSDPRMGLAPGLNASGVFDVEFLVQRHAEAVSGTTYVWEERSRQVYLDTDNSLTTSRSQRIVVENETTFVHNVSSLDRYIDGQRRFLQNYERYSDGSGQYTKWIQLDRVEPVYQWSPSPGSTAGFAMRPTGRYHRHLPFENSTVSRVDVGDRQHYVVRGTRSSVIEHGDVQNYTGRAVIRADGLVRSIDVRFRTMTPGGPARINYTSRYDELGNASVSPPPWLPAAREDLPSG